MERHRADLVMIDIFFISDPPSVMRRSRQTLIISPAAVQGGLPAQSSNEPYNAADSYCRAVMERILNSSASVTRLVFRKRIFNII